MEHEAVRLLLDGFDADPRFPGVRQRATPRISRGHLDRKRAEAVNFSSGACNMLFGM